MQMMAEHILKRRDPSVVTAPYVKLATRNSSCGRSLQYLRLADGCIRRKRPEKRVLLYLWKNGLKKRC